MAADGQDYFNMAEDLFSLKPVRTYCKIILQIQKVNLKNYEIQLVGKSWAPAGTTREFQEHMCSITCAEMVRRIGMDEIMGPSPLVA